MRVCPKCGHIDPPDWRHSKYSYWIDQTEYAQWLSMGYPEIPKGGKWEDEINVYRRTKKSGRVERKAKVDYGYEWNVPMEKHDVHDKRKHWARIKSQKITEFVRVGGNKR